MTTAPEHSGADLARRALQAARENAKLNPAQRRAVHKRSINARRRREAGDPTLLGAAVQQLVEDHAWDAARGGADIIDQWAEIAPELVGKVAAEKFDAKTGVLWLRPASSAARAHLALFQQQMVTRINAKAGREVVRALRVLTPGHVPDPEPAPAAPGFTAVKPAPAPVEEPAEPLAPHPAYVAALEAIRAAQQTAQETADQELRDRHFAGHRHVLREPDPAFTDAVTALETARQAQEKDTVRRATIEAARAQRTGRTAPVRRAFDQTA